MTVVDGGPGLDPGPPTVDERKFTRWAQPGWSSWDGWSPEADFCRFAGMLQRMLQPAVVLETGVGVGRLTSFLDLQACTYVGFEASPKWRRPPAIPDAVTPTVEQMAVAELVILDSHPPHRFAELQLWAEHGRSGSVCLIHDAGNGHTVAASVHLRVRAAVEATGLPEVFLRNPRGGWLGLHP